MWSEQDAASLHEFLKTETGKRLIEFIKLGAPGFNNESMEKAALASQQVWGFNMALDRFQQAIDFRNPTPSDSNSQFIPVHELTED